ncbi:hypothetical protein M378DRAFT_188919 [Amanita muscaria Koide BX008]|uniref:WD repeat-containing protein 75 second beta-propeller domain-containing protein n=1 Tax=Amanita muscaria (strain Koide BX008) TaxID=946122 RepID=A0A0C2T651_AMAMK|nr:hypothetical protein M378DRAFT_188919 [Amanita muscaria Koide BX008]
MAALKARQSHKTPPSPNPETRSKQSTKKGKLKGKEKETVPCTAVKRPGQQSVDWEWAILADPSASRTPPVFTKDGSYFFSLVGSSIKIYSAATGQIVSTLSAPRSTKTTTESSLLTSAILSPWNAFQLITGSLDGRLMVWDFLDATLLHTIDVVRPIIHICAHEKFRNTVFVAASTSNTKNNDDGIVLQVSLNPDADRDSGSRKPPVITSIGKMRFPTGLAFSPSGTYLVATGGHKVYVATTSSFKSGFVKYVSPEHLTCLAFHPFEDHFATGDQKGVIRLWYCLNESLAFNVKGIEKRTQTASFHWHAHAVSSIAFTSNGAYLLSGGEEAVLVIWQMPSGRKEFVPRLGAPINAVSVSKGSSEESYLVGLADATYSFINPGSLRVSRSYSGIKLDTTSSHGQLASKMRPPFTVHAISSTLILPSSHPSALQIYSPYSSKLLYELEVTPSNRVSRRDEKPIVPPRVEKIAVSPLGQWMATIDTREEDETFHGEIYLKLWRWDSKNAIWILNTRIDRPHGSKRLTALSFSPSSASYLVTTGEDGVVKIWGIRTAKRKSGEVEEFWVTRSTFALRSQVPNSASWSFDGSLLAISLGPHVAIYDPQTNLVRRTISSPESATTVAVRFIGKAGRHLAMVGRQDLTVWDLVTESVQWSHHTEALIQDIIPHPREDSFAIFHSNPDGDKTTASVFHVKSPSAVSEQTIPYRFQSIALFAASEPAFNFVGITTNWAIVSFGEKAIQPDTEGTSSSQIPVNAGPRARTLFQDIFGASAFEQLSAEQSGVQSFSTAVLPRSNAPVAALDRPSHLLPPISTIFDTFMSEFLHARPRSPVPTPKAEQVPETGDMDVDIPETVVLRDQQTRLVTQEEIDGLVDLFKSHVVDLKYTTSVNPNGKVDIPTKSLVNGKLHHVPSVSPASAERKLNGSTSTPKPVIKTPALTIPSPAPAPSVPQEATPQSSKKRKKSLN